MRKLILGLGLSVLASMFAVSEAQADPRRGYRAHSYYRPVAPPVRHYHRPHRNWVPYAVGGGLALGALGAGTYYYNNRYCWIEQQEVWDRRGRYLGLRDVKVCS